LWKTTPLKKEGWLQTKTLRKTMVLSRKSRNPHHPDRARMLFRGNRASSNDSPTHKDGDERFYDAAGSWIGRTHGDIFPWEEVTAAGQIVHKYWPKDHCLEHDALELGAEIWGLLEKFPDLYALILSDSRGEPVEITGQALCAMREAGDMTLYPAAYRLVLGE
jgi:hypothetical protein